MVHDWAGWVQISEIVNEAKYSLKRTNTSSCIVHLSLQPLYNVIISLLDQNNRLAIVTNLAFSVCILF